MRYTIYETQYTVYSIQHKYTMDNIEIISSFENIGRNQGVNVDRLLKERTIINQLKSLGA